MVDFDLHALCGEVQKVARQAGAYLKEEREKFDFSRIEEKSAHNYVSYVDKESERRIVDRLRALCPSAGFITEEGSAGRQEEAYYWVVDPLDGTSNYIHNLEPYCVSIALCGPSGTLLGVVYEVCRNECFYAVHGEKAYLDGREIRVSEVDTIDRAFIGIGFPYNAAAYHPTALRLVDWMYGRVGGVRLMGSAAIELCYVAAGRFDARIEAFLGPWDIAAGAFIVQQAGGKVTDLGGGDNWRSGREVLASNGSGIHEELVKVCR